jgi:O-methyltransferase involved in polyketide biosynthesis
LPPEAQDRLFDNITALSAPGSTVATEYVPGIVDLDEERAREMSAPLREQGVDIDMPSLIYTGQRSHVAEYLRSKSWDVTDTSRADLFVNNGRVVPGPENDDPLGEIIYISGTLKER